MKHKQFTEVQIVKALKKNESGRSERDICRDLGVSVISYYVCRKKYARHGGVGSEATPVAWGRE